MSPPSSGPYTVQACQALTSRCLRRCGLCAQEGPLAFYKGWLPSVIGVVPYVGLNFGVYETLKHMLLLHYGMRDERELSVPSRLACGAAAGTMGQTVAYPFDVARRRLQVGITPVLGAVALGPVTVRESSRRNLGGSDAVAWAAARMCVMCGSTRRIAGCQLTHDTHPCCRPSYVTTLLLSVDAQQDRVSTHT
jgi:hypothetical protein